MPGDSTQGSQLPRAGQQLPFRGEFGEGDRLAEAVVYGERENPEYCNSDESRCAMMNQFAISEITSALFVLLGFQTVAFTWRLNRELDVRKSAQEKVSTGVKSTEAIGVENWFPPADLLNLVSMALTIAAILSVLVGCSTTVGMAFMVGSLVLLICHPVALLIHYRLSPFKTVVYRVGDQKRASPGEFVFVGSALGLALGLIVGCWP